MEDQEQARPENGADERGEDEQPDLAQWLARGDQGRPEAAGRVGRCVVDRDRHDVDQREGETHHGTGDRDIRFPARRGQYDQDEHRGNDHLDEERTTARRVQQGETAPAVGTKPDPGLDIERRGVHDPQQQQRADDPADELSQPVADGLGDGKPPGEERTERHCRVHVAAGDRPDQRHQRREDDPEGQARDQHASRDAAPEGTKAKGDRRHTAAEEDQQSGTEELGSGLARQVGFNGDRPASLLRLRARG